MVTDAERLGMLGRREQPPIDRAALPPAGAGVPRGAPASRDRRAGVQELHVTVAQWAEPTDWRTAAHQYAEAGRWDDLRRVLDLHVETIVASGAFVTARDLVRLLPTAADSATAQVVLSRASGADGDYKLAAEYAASCSQARPDERRRDRQSRQSHDASGPVCRGCVNGERGLATARHFTPNARCSRGNPLRSSDPARYGSGRTDEIETCEALAEQCRTDGLTQFEGVGWLNAALATLLQGAA